MGKIIQDADRIYDIVEGCREKLAFLAEIVPVGDANDMVGHGLRLICREMVEQ